MDRQFVFITPHGLELQSCGLLVAPPACLAWPVLLWWQLHASHSVCCLAMCCSLPVLHGADVVAAAIAVDSLHPLLAWLDLIDRC